jgi:hypothetical protein
MSIDAARRYVELSNAGALSEALAMFADDATYESSQVGAFEGREAIGAMMRAFFAKFPGPHWEVPAYHEREPGEVEFDFVMTATAAESAERIERRGTERISFDNAGRIRRIVVEVVPPHG